MDKLSFEQFLENVRNKKLNPEQFAKIAIKEKFTFEQNNEALEAAQQSGDKAYQPIVEKMEKWKLNNPADVGLDKSLRASLSMGSNLDTSWVKAMPKVISLERVPEELASLHADRSQSAVVNMQQKEAVAAKIRLSFFSRPIGEHRKETLSKKDTDNKEGPTSKPK